ncbi:MAG: DNA alkylation repair protein [Gammaproteobacteria bacterium]|nr:DNA alkylation repair protein [Gammaproteobacteria bacterium]
MNTISRLHAELQHMADKEKALILSRFFKTGVGEYGEGDQFLGIKVPELRKVAKRFCDLKLADIKKLLYSKVHEERMIALLILLLQYQKAKDDAPFAARIYDFYVNNMRQVNNWDLVDLSAPNIVGHYLFTHNKAVLKTWTGADNLWVRRVAMLAPFYFIRQGEFKDALVVAKLLLNDKENLIHKAVGWMLREVGKRDLVVEEKFLQQHYYKMPRTMLRYAIERFDETKRIAYLRGEV